MALCFSFIFFLFFTSFFFLCNFPHISIAQHINFTSFNVSNSPWKPTQNRTLISRNSDFSVGFLPISNSRNHFHFSVWFTKVPSNAVVWSASSKAKPSVAIAFDSSASLTINSRGQLLINDSSGHLWTPENPSTKSSSATLFLDNHGNLKFGTWESFRFPTNTFLPTQSIDKDIFSQNGKFKFVNSSKLFFNSTNQYYSTPEGLRFKSIDEAGKMDMETGVFLTSDNGDKRFRKLVLEDDGNLRVYSFYPEKQNQWKVVWLAIQQLCEIKGKCGENAICMPGEDSYSSTYCVCPSGFIEKRGGAKQEGCQRRIELTTNTKFLRLDYVNFTSKMNHMRRIEARNFTHCEATCKSNPKCVGFGFKYDGSAYCVVLEQLLFGYWSPGTETALFLKVDISENEKSNFTGMTEILETTCPVEIRLPQPPKDSDTTTRNIVIICTLFAAEFISGVAFFWSFLKRYIKYRDMATTLSLELLPAGGPKRFTYSELKTATNDFSNLIGKGGFGDVYKGKLLDHRIVAVKCLKNVTSGDAEFWAEVTIIARMHHLNLVRLWGFCAEKGQRILVYEFISGGSLDTYLFRSRRVVPVKSSEEEEGTPGHNPLPDPNTHQKPILDWNVRYRIALGVARAMAYLHEECLEWVLHCDIKPENILLGDDFCPKISDFGLAKLRKKEDIVTMSKIGLAKLRKKEDIVTMSKRRGTPGYMAPEWITADPITSKADVYSFGMVLLELVTGIRNFEIQRSQVNSDEWYFPGWAFDKMFKEAKVEDILDTQIKHCYDSRAHLDLVTRMVKTAMWCLQDKPESRPNMGKVAKMLEGTVEIIEPKKPTVFFLGGE